MNGRRGAFLVALVILTAVGIAGQATTIRTAGDGLGVDAPAFRFIEGPVLDRLRDGRSVVIDLELAVLAAPGGAPVARSRQRFNLSFDLWEERIAVTLHTTPARSVSHLSAAAAEAWCVARLAVPLADLGRLGRDAPFWVRLVSEVGPASRAATDGDEGLTLQRLIDLFSRRRPGELGKAMEAGPFRLSH